jgi:hypothetical protein
MSTCIQPEVDEYSSRTETQGLQGSSLATASSTSTIGDGDDVTAEHPAVVRMKPRIQKCRILMGGTPAVREAGELVLPRYPRESDQRYFIRRDRVALFNGYKTTVTGFVGLIYRSDPTLGTDMPAKIVTDAEDIDRRGTKWTVFFRKVLTDATVTGGPAGVLVDYPRVEGDPTTLTRPQAKKLNLRPYAIHIRADQVVSFRPGEVDGVPSLMQIVFRETDEVAYGRFGVKMETAYRVYRRTRKTVTVEVWRLVDGATSSEGVVSGQNYKMDEEPVTLSNMDEIPFAPHVLGEEKGYLESDPPLDGLADLVLEYHREKTGLSNIRGLACVPTIKRKGYIPRTDNIGNVIREPVFVGTEEVIDVPIEGDVDYFSPDVSVCEPGDRALTALRGEMGAVALAALAPDPTAPETATANRLDSSAQHGGLAVMAQTHRDCIEKVFQLFAKFRKLPKSGSVTVNTDFELLTADPTLITALSSAATSGNLPIEDFLRILVRIKLLPADYNVDDAISSLLSGVRGLASLTAFASTKPSDKGNAGDGNTPAEPTGDVKEPDVKAAA